MKYCYNSSIYLNSGYIKVTAVSTNSADLTVFHCNEVLSVARER
jgi:hypothetical protein